MCDSKTRITGRLQMSEERGTESGNDIHRNDNGPPIETENEIVDGADEGDLDHSDSAPPSVIIEKNDRSLDELARWYTDGRLTLDPEWQRNYVWKDRAASRLIESFLIDLPVPVIYLARSAEGAYEVIDGLQRLTSVFNYFNGKLKLTGLEIRPKLNGKAFKDLER